MTWTRTGALGIVALVITGLLAPAASASASEAGGTFLDDDGTTHEGMIEALAAEGTLSGCNPAGTLVCPTDALTRGQMASFLAQALDLAPASRDHFTDDGGVHEDNINRLGEAGIASGRADGTFGGAEPVRRDQLATFLAAALDLPAERTGPFTDVAGVHAGNINAVATAGITTGCDATGTRFCPGSVVTRGQAASFVGRAIGASATTPPPLTDASPIEHWCSAAQRFVRTLSPADQALLADYEYWYVGRQRPDRFGPGSLPLQLITLSPFTGDGVVAGWSRPDGLLTDLAGLGDEQWSYPVLIEWTGSAWDCGATAG